MKSRRVDARLVACGILVCGLVAPIVFAGDSVTVKGSIGDINGNPLRNVEVSAVAQGGDGSFTARSKKNGSFSIELPDSDLTYDFTFVKEGFDPVSAELRPVPEELSPLVVTLALTEITPNTPERDLAIPVFNEGVAVLETGDKAAALEKFRQACEIDPDFADAARATAAVAMELEDFATAADAAENLVRLKPDDLAALSTAYFSELMLIDVERLIPAARRLADASPEVVSNEMVQHAAVLFDNEELAGSRSLLELVIEKEPETSAAYLQLGLVCNMAGDSACAKDALASYLELAPDGPDAATARSLLEYLQ